MLYFGRVRRYWLCVSNIYFEEMPAVERRPIIAALSMADIGEFSFHSEFFF